MPAVGNASRVRHPIADGGAIGPRRGPVAHEWADAALPWA
jgi:hypothetical protein